MRTFPLLSISLLFFTIMAFPASASASPEKTEGISVAVRIGYVDFNRALNEVSDGRSAKLRLKDEFKEKQQRLDLQQNELAALKSEIDRDRLLLSDDALRVKEEQYRNKFFELQQMLAAFRREMETREANLTSQILSRLKSIVKEIGGEAGYSLILEKSQDVVLYAPEGDDLTNRVIEAYDRGGKRKRR